MLALRQQDHRTHSHQASYEGGDTAPANDLEEILTAAQPRLKHFARAQGIRIDEVDDVVQETLLEAWRHLEQLREPARFDAWLGGICRNVCLRWARRQATVASRQLPFSVHPCASADPALSFCPTDVPDLAAHDLVEEVSHQDLKTLLDRAFSYLPVQTRQALELHYLADIPQREVAALLGLSTGALEVRLSRARRQLRQLLSTKLRTDAASLGLVLDEEQPQGWRESRLWCMQCGRQRLLGFFAPLPDGTVDLWLCCPVCSPPARGVPLIRTQGAVPLGTIRSFRPAWKRIVQTAAHQYAPVFETGALICSSCGGRAPVSEAGLHPMEAVQGSNRFCLVVQCIHCGQQQSASVFSLLAALPSARQFMSSHARWVIEPEVLTEYLTSPALRVRLVDIASASGLTLFLHRHTLQLLASFLE